MTTTLLDTPLSHPRADTRIDNRLAYSGFTVAYLLGHGGAALSMGPDAAIAAPGWLPTSFLIGGMVVGTIASIVTGMRAQKAMNARDARAAMLASMAWITGFAGLFLAITGLAASTGDPGLQTLLWPAGSAMVVGLIYLAEGSARHDSTHYALGSVLILLGGGVLFLPTAAALGILAVVGGAAYLAAALRVHRSLAAARA